MCASLTATTLVAAPQWGAAQTAPRWPDEHRAGAFLCHADFPLGAQRRLLEEMSKLQGDVIEALRIQPTDETIHIFLFRRQATYGDYVSTYFPDVPYRRALFIKERGPGMVFAYRNSQLGVDLRHESTHALLHTALPMVPLWLDEGLAEYFEVPSADRARGHPHLKGVAWGIRFGRSSRLEELERVGRLEDMGQSEYRQAWAWVHFMLHGSPVARDELVRYLRDIQARSPPGQLSQRLRNRLPDLDRRFAKHFTRWSPILTLP